MKKILLAATAFTLSLTACETKLVEQVDLIPQAESVVIQNGSFALAKLQSIQVPEEWKPVAGLFAGDLQKTASLALTVADDGGTLAVSKNETLPAEAYTLSVGKNGIKVEAGDIRGLNHALVTLRQLIMTAGTGNFPSSPYRTSPTTDTGG